MTIPCASLPNFWPCYKCEAEVEVEREWEEGRSRLVVVGTLNPKPSERGGTHYLNELGQGSGGRGRRQREAR